MGAAGVAVAVPPPAPLPLSFQPGGLANRGGSLPNWMDASWHRSTRLEVPPLAPPEPPPHQAEM